jgi:biopolymer transport protein ExbB
MSNPLEAYGEPDPAPAESGGGPPASADTSIGWINFSDLTDLLEMGGPVTLVLLAMSLITLTVILAKLWQFARAGVGRYGALDEALAFWSRGRQDEAAHRLIRQRGVASRVALHAMSALQAGADEHRVREDTERVALSELSNLQSGLRVIEATVQTAPLLGLFGTVLGMIASFQALEGSGAQADPAVLAGGIWVALLTTAVGLAIAIPAALALTWFQGRIDRERARIEDAATSVFTRRLVVPVCAAKTDGPFVPWQAKGPDGGARNEAL